MGEWEDQVQEQCFGGMEMDRTDEFPGNRVRCCADSDSFCCPAIALALNVYSSSMAI